MIIEDTFTNRNLFLIQEDVQPLEGCLVIESCRTEGEFLQMLFLSTLPHMNNNTFISWEPHGEREKRVITVTYAVRSALPSTAILLGLQHSHPRISL